LRRRRLTGGRHCLPSAPWHSLARYFAAGRGFMRIAVIGAGGIGAIYGAALAKAGADVTFIARGAHLAAMREHGLRVEGDRGDTVIRPAQATDDVASIGPGEYALLCAKLWDVES